MKIGSVFDQTSTTEFVVMLDQQYDSERLLFSYVELAPDGGQPQPNGERIIARIINVLKENPLLSRDQAGIAAAVDVGGLGYEFSRRFTYGWAQCNVIGSIDGNRRTIDMNRRSVSPNAEVHTPSPQTLRQLFFNPSPSYIPVGSIETFDRSSVSEVPITLDADQLVTKHFCIFGMTGSGKTNTAARIIEELMARGHRMVVFDSHDDYQNIEVFTNLFRDIDDSNQTVRLSPPQAVSQAVQEARNLFNCTPSVNRNIDDCVRERLLRVASVIYQNKPARKFLMPSNRATQAQSSEITPNFVQELGGQQPWQSLIEDPQVRELRAFPELRHYGPDYVDFSISLLEAFQGEGFSPAQWRWLRGGINQRGHGINFLQNLYLAARNVRHDETRRVLQERFNGLQDIYNDAINSNVRPLDLATFFQEVCSRANGRPETLYRLSISDLSSNLRKAMVYGVVTYFFRAFKFGGNRAVPRGNLSANAYPVLFALEEARSLIPRSFGQEQDKSGQLARRAMRELAYEGRKFSLGFGLISQKPSTVDQEVVSQSNTFILHQLKSPDDQQYVRSVTESMSLEELDMIKNLGTGRAIVSGVAVQSPVLVDVYFRYSEEGIAEPRPIRDGLVSADQIRQQLGVT